MQITLELDAAEYGWLRYAIRCQIREGKRKEKQGIKQWGEIDPTSSMAARLRIGPIVDEKVRKANQPRHKFVRALPPWTRGSFDEDGAPIFEGLGGTHVWVTHVYDGRLSDPFSGETRRHKVTLNSLNHHHNLQTGKNLEWFWKPYVPPEPPELISD